MAQSTTSYEQLHTAFSHGKFAPLYLFYGDETFLMKELQEVLLDNALLPHERDFNLDIFYGSEADVRQVIATCSGFPMMAARRVVIVRDFNKMADNRLFVQYAERPNTNAVVLLVCEGKPGFNAHPFRALRQHAICCEFGLLSARKIPGWIEARLAASGREIEPRALQMLVDTLGPGLATVSGEVDRLISYAGDRLVLTSEDVLRAGGHTREHNVFEFQRMVGERQFDGAFRIAERLLQKSPNPRSEAIRMLSVVGSFFGRLWRLAGISRKGASEADMARLLGVRPYFVKEYVHALRKWGSPQLERAFAALLAADFELKGGSSRDDLLIILLTLQRMDGASTPARAA